MTGNMRRLQNFLSGKSSAMLDRPEQRLAVYISDINKQIRTLERSVAQAAADKNRLQKQIEGVRARSSECEARILTALEKGNENVAKAFLEKQEQHDAEVASLESAWNAQNETASQLVASLELSKTRREDAKQKRDLLVAEHRWAETRKKMRDRALKIAAPALIAQLENKIRAVEAEAEAELVQNAAAVDEQIEAGLKAIDARRRGDGALDQFRSRLSERKERGEDTEKGDATLDRLKKKLAQRKAAAAHQDEATERVENLKRALDS
jgi:phage shock protein A